MIIWDHGKYFPHYLKESVKYGNFGRIEKSIEISDNPLIRD